MKIKTRLAPTPSGLLHWGNLFNFCLIWHYARLQEGSIQLRIDDLDLARSQETSLRDIVETLQWLGFKWEHGPKDFVDFKKNFSQQLYMESYFSELKKIPHYVCECSRLDLKARGVEGYDGYCRHRNLEFKPGTNQVRFFSSDPSRDVVVWRKENLAAYHWVSVLEDEKAEINLIIRGEDLRESSEIQRELARAAGLKFYPKAHILHHRLLVDEQKRKLSKSDFSESIQEWRVKGKSSEEVFRELSRRAQWPFVIEKLDDLLEYDSIDPCTE